MMSSPSKISINSKYSGCPWGITPKCTVYAKVITIDDKEDLIRIGKLKNVRYTKTGYDTSFDKPPKVKGFNLKLLDKSSSSTSDPDGTWYFFREDAYTESFTTYSNKWKVNTQLNELFNTRKKRSGQNGQWLKSYFNTEGQDTQELDVSTDYAKSPGSNMNPQAFSIQPRANTAGKSPRIIELPSASQLCTDTTNDKQGTMHVYLFHFEKCSYIY